MGGAGRVEEEPPVVADPGVGEVKLGAAERGQPRLDEEAFAAGVVVDGQGKSARRPLVAPAPQPTRQGLGQGVDEEGGVDPLDICRAAEGAEAELVERLVDQVLGVDGPSVPGGPEKRGRLVALHIRTRSS